MAQKHVSPKHRDGAVSDEGGESGGDVAAFFGYDGKGLPTFRVGIAFVSAKRSCSSREGTVCIAIGENKFATEPSTDLL